MLGKELGLKKEGGVVPYEGGGVGTTKWQRLVFKAHQTAELTNSKSHIQNN